MKELIAGITSILSGVAIYSYSSFFSDRSNGLPGDPALFPKAASITLALLGLVLSLKTLTKVTKQNKNELVESNYSHTKPIILLSILILYSIAFEYAGYITATFTFILTSMMLMGSHKKTSIVMSLILTGSLYFIFFIIFGSTYPEGLIY